MDRRGRPRAVVTGGAGFIGAHIVTALASDGTEVLVIDDLSTGDVASVDPAARLERLDIATDDLGSAFRAFRPAIVYHLAAQSSVPRSAKDPRRDLAVNVDGTARVLEAARLAGVRRVIFASSGGAVYGERRRAATEATCPAPASYYGIHKLAAEGHVALSGIGHAIARPSNVYGPGQRAGLEGAVVAAFVDQATRLGSLEIHGDGEQTRDLVHVSDVVAALRRLGEVDDDGTWNIASGRRTSVNGLADRIERLLGRTLVRQAAPRRPGDVRDSAISAARLRSLGWRPAVGLEAGLRELLELASRRAP